jgi:hypothetical protein
MLENKIRPALEVLLAPLSQALVKFTHLSPYMLTIASLIGLAVLPLMLLNLTKLALIALWLAYCLNLMSGSLVIAKQPLNAVNALYDILALRTIDFAIIFGFYLLNPGIIAWIGLLILASNLIASTAHLAIGILQQAKPGFLYHNFGLIDRLEIFIIYSILIVFPFTYGILGVGLAILLLCSAAFRVLEFQRGA